LWPIAVDAALQGFAIEKFHGHELPAILLADVIDGAYVRVI
jgi:hypothetical protein